MTSLIEQVRDIHDHLADAGIPHAFGGALALAFHTDDPRGTSDIDVNVFVGPDQAAAVFGSLPPGVSWSDNDLDQVATESQVRLFWGDTPVDLFFSNHPFHDRVAESIDRVPFADRELPILGADELAVFKAFFNRTKDWADIEAMRAVDSFDPHVVLGWLADLLGPEDERVMRLRDLLHREPGPEPRFAP
jgi:hypothetical protein